jgi:flagellar hook-length control protein FliK
VRPAQVTLPNEAATSHSIVQTIRLQAANGGGTAVITLTPKYLGAVTVSLRVSEGGVTATLQAENGSVRTWIEANAPLLKDGLAERGLTLTEMVVAEPDEPRRQMEDQPRRQAEGRSPGRRPRRREESSFDVLV